uniref:Uncharacterized protein n=1 Tax=Musa acuminata subsp. malaccensis TaxID=214687 RepID=A0A804KJJ5_MUSAM
MNGMESSAAPLAQGGRRLRGPKRIKKWTWMRLWLIILIDSRNSFGVGPRDQKLLLHVTPGRDKKWHSKPSLGMSWTNGHLGLYVWSKRILYRRSTLNSFRLLHHQLF